MSESTCDVLQRVWAAYKQFNKSEGRPTKPCPKLICRDGFEVSVQVGEYSYSTPRLNEGPWTHAEIGFPTSAEESWLEWCEDPERPTDTVYGYVPIEVIADVLDKHGGIFGAVLWGLKQ